MANDNIYPPFVNPLKIGRPLAYTPEELAEKFEDYVRWAIENPIVTSYTEIGVSGKNSFEKKHEEISPRLISIGGFLSYIGKEDGWWAQLPKRQDGERFVRVKAAIKNYCETFQKEMASAGVFNANIISRLLGLTDKSEVEHKGITLNVTASEEGASNINKIIKGE